MHRFSVKLLYKSRVGRALQRVHIKAQAEHTWPLNIYLNLQWPRERERERERPANIANYNIISLNSSIDEPLELNQTWNKEWGNYLGIIDCTSVVCFSPMFSLLCGLATNALSWLQLQAGEARRRALELPVKILWIGAMSLLWSQSHNLKQSSVSLKRCLQHFFIICFYSSKCCSLLLWLWFSVALSLSLCLWYFPVLALCVIFFRQNSLFLSANTLLQFK